MAPEIIRGEEYTKAADVYSYGMILWELSSGKFPFENLSKKEIISKVGYGDKKVWIIVFYRLD